MNPLKETYKLRAVIPRAGRERLYNWHPGSAARWRRFPGVQRVSPTGRVILTFDDGPDEDATPAVLEALDSAGATATFFVLGSQVEAHPDLAKEVVARGHELGLHGYAHERQDRIEPARSRDDLLRASSVIEDILGMGCQWYRPPFGKMSAAAAQACQELRLTTVYWSAWGVDWEAHPASRIAELVSEQMDDGAIVLLHDSPLHGHRRSALPTAEAIARIAECAGERGLALTSLAAVSPPARNR